LCDVLAKKHPGRIGDDEVTVFKSLGMAIEDIACAALAVARAKERRVGTDVTI